jgi:hypothetical protein
VARCLQVAKFCQHYEAREPYGFEWRRHLSRRWVMDTSYGTGIVVVPEGDPTGWEYISSGGRSAAEEPVWPTVLGATVKDGSITWTTQAYSAASLIDGIDTDSWTLSAPVGVTVTPVAPAVSTDSQFTSAVLEAVDVGSVGTEYTIENEIVTDLGYEYVARILLTIEGP